MSYTSHPADHTADRFDLAIVGAGIVGLAHAVEAHARGLRVCVLERDDRAVGASIRNFGHIGVTIQAGNALEYAKSARERWLWLGEKCGFPVAETGTVIVARSPAQMSVLAEFAAARGADEVRLLDRPGVAGLFPPAGGDVVGGAHLPLDLRVDPRAALPAIAEWLVGEGVEIRWGTHVGVIEDGRLLTSSGELRAERIVHAVGHDTDRLFPGIAEEYELRRCRLLMLEVAPPSDVRFEPAVLTGTSMLRYDGLTATPSAAAVRREFEASASELIEVAMNLMLTQRPDGSIVLGDTHHYARTHLPFDDEQVAELLLREGTRLLGARPVVRRRWSGVYAYAAANQFLVAAPYPTVRVVSVTSGIGMTTALGLAPVVLDQLH